jgi:DinB superfamily
MTPAERAELVDLLLKSEKELLELVEGLNESQWTFKPGPDRWSAGEVTEHIMLADAALFDAMQKMMAGPQDPDWFAQTAAKTDRLKQALPNRTRRVDAPEPLKPAQALTRAEVMNRYKQGRARALEFARKTDAPIKAYTGKNPFFGPLNGYQFLIYIPLHNLRHNQQILEVKASPGFPSSSSSSPEPPAATGVARLQGLNAKVAKPAKLLRSSTR